MAAVEGATVLVVEDDASLRGLVARSLREHGAEVVTAADGAGALQALGPGPAARFSAIVLDIGLPDSDGRDLCLALRASGLDVPVLFLTARDGLHDKVAGFQSGGDDYVTKPFELEELRVRLEALLRRSSTPVEAASGETVLDPARHALVVGGTEVALTPTEFRLLGRLMAEPSTVVRRHTLVAAAWPHGAMVSDNTLDSYVRRIRSKLEPHDVSAISTVRGVGYRWR
jgi:two-component system response regulator MprA